MRSCLFHPVLEVLLVLVLAGLGYLGFSRSVALGVVVLVAAAVLALGYFGDVQIVWPPLRRGRARGVGEETQAVGLGSIAPDWHHLSQKRVQIYQRYQGLFLVHTWERLDGPRYKARITMRLEQHNEGPLSRDAVAGVQYVWGRRFNPLSETVASRETKFAATCDAYLPALVLAHITFTDGTPPMILWRYANFD